MLQICEASARVRSFFGAIFSSNALLLEFIKFRAKTPCRVLVTYCQNLGLGLLHTSHKICGNMIMIMTNNMYAGEVWADLYRWKPHACWFAQGCCVECFPDDFRRGLDWGDLPWKLPWSRVRSPSLTELQHPHQVTLLFKLTYLITQLEGLFMKHMYIYIHATSAGSTRT